MYYIPHIGFINAHSKGIGSHHNRISVINKIVLVLSPFTVTESRMVTGNRKTVPPQPLADLLHHFSGQAVNNPAFFPVKLQIIFHRGIFIFGSLHGKIEIRPVKAGRQHLRGTEHKNIYDIIPDLFGSRCRKSADHRPLRQHSDKL